jgi:carbon-monoxide dehydrogenase large subunit
MTGVDERTREVGAPRRRKEDARPITGRTRWTDNIQLPGMLHVAMARSPMAHATIALIDTTAAKAAPGVVAVFSGADAEEQGSLPNAWLITPEQVSPNHPSIAVDTVNFAGEIVAVVVAAQGGDLTHASLGCPAAGVLRRRHPHDVSFEDNAVPSHNAQAREGAQS